MMKERGLSKSLRLMFSSGMVVGLGLMAPVVMAQQILAQDAAQQVQTQSVLAQAAESTVEAATPVAKKKVVAAKAEPGM